MTESPAAVDTAKQEAFAEGLLDALSGAMKVFGVYLGDKLGLYPAMRDGVWRTASELARDTETQTRYVREWLEQQAVNGIVEVDDAAAEPDQRRFRLPAEQAEVLADPESLNFMAPLGQILAGATYPLDRVVDAFRTGGGVSFDRYGRDMREGQSRMNRAMFLHELGQKWLPTMPDVHRKLSDASSSRIADVGCGTAWSAIGMARTYPGALVDGFDLDRASIEDARRNVSEANVGDRVRVFQRDCGDPELAGEYDLVTAFECVHDLSDPVSVLSAMRRMMKRDGAALVADENVAERFSPDCEQVDRIMYGWSILHCLPAGMCDHPSRGTGTVMRPKTLEGYALEAGFSRVEILPVDNLFFRFYRLWA